ncbi:MAG: hypothetical protein ABIU09_00455 [Pyrinomonadaceae bacterium]
MSEKDRQFVLCIKNDGCDDLQIRKVYEVQPDESAATDDYLRIIDESGEDYLYPANYFYPVEIAQHIRETLLHAA